MSLLAIASARRRAGLPLDDPTFSWPALDTSVESLPVSAPWNAANYLSIPTYDGSNAAIHPSVVDFYGQPWRGRRFWMAFTPWPNDAGENPSILVSDDGHAWQPPEGLVNPIYPWSGVAGCYNSDTELAYDPDGDRLVCYWREVAAADFTNTRTDAKWSSDGINWSAMEVTIPAGGHREMLSPSMLRRGPGDWWAFGMMRPDTTRSFNGLSVRRAAGPLGPWGPAQFVALGTIPDPWHGDVIWDGRAFRALISKHSSPTVLWALSSRDGYAWSEQVEVMAERAGSWDATLYRPTMTVKDADWLRVWYSAVGANKKIGYTQIPRSLWPAPPD